MVSNNGVAFGHMVYLIGIVIGIIVLKNITIMAAEVIMGDAIVLKLDY